jgi:nicotinamide mononucleotide transporter
MINAWISNNYIEVFGAVTGVVYVFLEIRQKIWLWPVGIITSAIYIWIFFTSKFYADMSLQGYYLVISIIGWYWWVKGTGRRAQGTGEEVKKRRVGERETGENGENVRKSDSSAGYQLPITKEKDRLVVTRLKRKTGLIMAAVFVFLYFVMWLVLSKLTDSPVPEWDSFITSLSIVATWMLARKIFEHWYLWIIVNFVSAALFISRGLYPTVILYCVYCIMSFAGLTVWKKTIRTDL